MEPKQQATDAFNEQQSLQVMKEMIQVSKNKINNDAILFIVWGWIFFVNYFVLNYLSSVLFTPNSIMSIIRILRVALPIFGIVFSVYYVLKQRNRVQTYIGISLRYVWISLFICLMLVNLIQFNVLHSINFELQHPTFMVFIAFAITVTGGILRYRLIIIGGILFAVLAYTASYFNLQEQLLIESIGWLLAFIIPGHILFAKREKQ